MEKKTEKEIGFTRIANTVCRDPFLCPFDKAVYMAIASCDPSFPSYETIMKWTGISRERLWKSLRNLEKFEMISRIKQGKKIVYRTYWTSSPHELIEGQSVRFTNLTSSPHELEPVRHTNPNKNKETDQIKKEKKETAKPLLNEALGEEEIRGMVRDRFGVLDESTTDDCPF